jgi:hypothetical protein
MTIPTDHSIPSRIEWGSIGRDDLLEEADQFIALA